MEIFQHSYNSFPTFKPCKLLDVTCACVHAQCLETTRSCCLFGSEIKISRIATRMDSKVTNIGLLMLPWHILEFFL